MKKSLTYSYVAGLFDGEGSVTLTKKRKTDEFRTVVVSMSSTSIELLAFLRNEFGGCIVRNKKYKPHHKDSWSWSLERRRALCFLNKIIPYMIEKSKLKRSKLAVSKYEKVTPRNGRYSDKLRDAKMKFEKDFFAS